MDREVIKRKIEKLLALSESTNENEAMSAARTARKLMLKYHISMAEGEKASETDSAWEFLRLLRRKIRKNQDMSLCWRLRQRWDRYGIGTDSFFGVLRKFYRRGARYLDLEWNILLNPKGEVIYCLPETAEAKERGDYRIGPCDYHYLRLPYPSGTLVETMASPFFPAIKGVLVNRAESWEEEFDQTDEQWLVYRDTLHESQDAGIGVILLNHYASFAFGADFILPFIQFFKRYDGTLSESERWLGELLRKDKSCFALILRDRQPGKQPEGEADRPRAYVRELEKRLRQGETKRLVWEKREMKRKGG